MKVLAILAVYAATGLQAATADVLFYGGDLDFENAMFSERSQRQDARVYDDFSLVEASLVTGIFGSFALTSGLPTVAYFEVRSGISPGNGGTLLASGEFSVQSTYLGGGIGPNYWRFSGEIAPLELAPGDYWVAMALVNDDGGACLIGTTSGANGEGGPLQNGNSFFDCTFFYEYFAGYNFASTQRILGPGSWDFSIGVEGHAVPEVSNAIIVLSGLGLVAKLSRMGRPSHSRRSNDQ